MNETSRPGSILRVAAIQMQMAEDPDSNRQTIADRVAEAASAGADLVVLPELHNLRYFCQVQDPALFDLAEAIPGPSTEALAALAREHGVVIVGSLFERRASGVYHNTAVVLDSDGSLAGVYRKMHIPDDPGYNEKFYFTPGDSEFTPILTSVGHLGVLVCWDQWYPEAARLMTLAGADLLIYPTAIGWDHDEADEENTRQRDAWEWVQRGHAVANAIPLVACNRVGDEPRPGGGGSRFWGHSLILGPQGETLSVGSENAGLVSAEIDLARTEQVRRIWPFLRDRRIDAYSGLTQRVRKLPE